jgi:16S rRNA (guanine527-N7)-methyltransferase
MLQQWQRSQRLIGSTEPGWIIRNLFLDSLMFLRLLPDTVRSMADLGSGAGFPGIPIKIVRPEISVTLIESRGRRASFLAAVVRALGLVEVRVLNARAEQVAAESPGSFGAVVMRCAGAPHDVMPLAARLVSPGGVVIASGPPTTRPLPLGVWHEVVGLHGQVRRFAIYRA